ncbi:tetratricopeptide repeat protein [Leptolyngbya sp. 15MV]|nr:tetratricopeptide repeat protein [Leptolyngbya sp. 15MV]
MQQLADLGYILPPSADAAERLAVLKREVAFNLATVYMTTRRVHEALPIYERLNAEHPGEPRFALNVVQCYFDRGRFADARRVLAEFLRLHPGHAEGELFLGLALAQEGSPEEAVPLLRRAEERFPDRADVLSTLGWGYIVARRADEAHRVLERARALDPHEPRTHHTLALVALEQERFEAAVEHCLDALDVQHVYADAHHTLGVALTWLKDFTRAIQAFNSAISMQPGLIDSHRFLASIYRHIGDRVNASKHRKIAEELIAQRDAGREHRADFLREPPMGPLDWSKRTGVPAE